MVRPQCEGVATFFSLTDTLLLARAVCRNSHKKLRYCVLASICPVEAKSLEECMGVDVPGLEVKKFSRGSTADRTSVQ